MKRIDAHRTDRSASYKHVSRYKAAVKDAQDIADLRAQCTFRWDNASPAVLSEIDEYIEALSVARK